jgi:hypothetical protein
VKEVKGLTINLFYDIRKINYYNEKQEFNNNYKKNDWHISAKRRLE